MPLTPSDLVHTLAAAGDPQMSPDGSYVVFTWSGPGSDGSRTSQIRRVQIDGSNLETHAAFGTGTKNVLPRLSPDGRSIAVVSDRLGTDAVFVSDDGGDARLVVKATQLIVDLAWAPDGKTLAYITTPGEPIASAVPLATTRVDYKQENRGFLDTNRWQVFTVPVEGGEPTQRTFEPYDHTEVAFSPDGTWLGVTRNYENALHSQIVLIPLAGGDPVLVGGRTGKIDGWSWSPDGSRLVICHETTRTWQTGIFIYDLASGRLEAVNDELLCLPEPGFFTISPPARPVWLSDTMVALHAVYAGSSGVYTCDLTNGEIRLLLRLDSLNAGFSADSAGRYFAMAHGSTGATGEIEVFDREANTSRLVTANNTATLSEHRPGTVRKCGVRRGGLNIDGWILYPPDFDPEKKYPVVLDIHGGPNAYYGSGWNAIQQLLASNGFVVVYSNPRGSAGYGREFSSMVLGDWGNEDMQDILAVLDVALQRPGLAADRVGVWGYSYGGYAASWLIGHTDRFKAAVIGGVAYDLRSLWGTSDFAHTFGRYEWGGAPWERREFYHDRSPSTWIQNARTPSLIVHGEADARCPVGQSEMLFTDLKELGVETELVGYPGAYHAIFRTGSAAHREDVLTRMLAWFKRWLGSAVR